MLEAAPVRVATVSAIDTDIALALGVVPVSSPQYGTTPLDPWTVDAAAALGVDGLDTWDSTDGTAFEALATAAPDVILATSGWNLAEDYERLADIAPVVSYSGADGLTSMTWAERTRAAAEALGVPAAGETAVATVAAAFADARAAHPAFEGTTFTYAVLHPHQVSYLSTPDADMDFFTDLGLVRAPAAERFDAAHDSVSLEQLDLLAADLLLVGFPWGDEGVVSQQEFEASPLVRDLAAVREGHYLVVGDDYASPLAYPSPLSQVWVLQRLLPGLAEAVDGAA